MTSNLDIERLAELRELVDTLIQEIEVIEYIERTGQDNDYYDEILKAHNDNVQEYKHFIIKEMERKG